MTKELDKNLVNEDEQRLIEEIKEVIEERLFFQDKYEDEFNRYSYHNYFYRSVDADDFFKALEVGCLRNETVTVQYTYVEDNPDYDPSYGDEEECKYTDVYKAVATIDDILKCVSREQAIFICRYFNLINEYGQTSLMLAETAEQTEDLIEAGADVNARDLGDKTSLMYAKTAEQMKLLIEAGADVNARDLGDKTPLMYAKTAEQMKLLIEAGADVNVRDCNRRTIFDHARVYGDINKIELLKKYDPVLQKIAKHKDVMKKAQKHRKEYLKAHPDEKLSGPVLADKIAEDVISGKEKRTITPSVAMDIRRKKAFNR